MAFNNKYEFFRRNGGFLNEEFNVLPVFGFSHSSDTRRSVEDIGSKTVATYKGDGKYEISTTAPNLYFKTIGYDVTYERKKEPTGRALELEERFQALLKEKGKNVDDTKYVPADVFSYYLDGGRPSPDFLPPKTGKFLFGAIFSLICLVVSIILVGFVFAEQIEAMIPEFLQSMGLYSMQIGYPLFVVFIGLAALFFVIFGVKRGKYNRRLEKFKARTFDELKPEEIAELKRKLESTVRFAYDDSELGPEALEIIQEMIALNNKKYYRWPDAEK